VRVVSFLSTKELTLFPFSHLLEDGNDWGPQFHPCIDSFKIKYFTSIVVHFLKIDISKILKDY